MFPQTKCSGCRRCAGRSVIICSSSSSRIQSSIEAVVVVAIAVVVAVVITVTAIRCTGLRRRTIRQTFLESTKHDYCVVLRCVMLCTFVNGN